MTVLLLTAASVGFIHTLLGPDHYLPFIMIGRARNWAPGKAALVTAVCGVGHVIGSVLLGILGVALGIAVGSLERFELFRGELASLLLVGFGIAYGAWGLRIGLRASQHSHTHGHGEERHEHPHHHLTTHTHLHGDSQSITPWALFIIFVLGPCEPLIPLLMYPAAEGSWWTLALVVLAFGITTVATMTAVVALAISGVACLSLGPVEKYVHAIAGLIIAVSGLTILLFE